MEEYIGMNIEVVEYRGKYWIVLTQVEDHWKVLVKMIMKIRFPRSAMKFLNGYSANGLSERDQLHVVNFTQCCQMYNCTAA
jgi:hypothetical protein